MTTFATVADLEGLADGTTVYVKPEVTASRPDEFTKQGSGLIKDGSTVPFRVFTGYLAQGLVADDNVVSPVACHWYHRGTYDYYVFEVSGEQVKYMLFNRGSLADSLPRTRALTRWMESPKRESTDEDLAVIGGIHTVQGLLRTIHSLQVEVEAREARLDRDSEVREKLRQIRRIAAE